MPITARRPAPRAAALAAALFLAPGVAAAQATITVHADAPDSVSFVTRRQPVDEAAAALRTNDRYAAVLLTDSTLVLQLTERGLLRVAEEVEDASPEGTGARILSRMLGAGLVGLLDHGIAYRLAALREARVEGSRFVLEDRAGKRVFEGVEVNGRRVMEEFPPEEAERFARAVNRAIRARR